MPDDRTKALKWLLRAVALVMGVGFGLSHLFFPESYFGFMGQGTFDKTDTFQLFLANTCGALIIALCVGLWIAAGDLIRYRVVVIMFIVAGTLIVPVFFYHLAFTGALTGLEWLNMVAVGLVTLAVYRLYPWQRQ